MLGSHRLKLIIELPLKLSNIAEISYADFGVGFTTFD